MKHKIFKFILAEGARQVAMSNKKQSFGFTLAEVLITLGIIGVVAAITMPTLIQNYQKQVYVNQLKKTVSMLEQGFQKLLADEEVDKLSDLSYWPQGQNRVPTWRSEDDTRTFIDNVLVNSFNVKFNKANNYSMEFINNANGGYYEEGLEDGYNNHIQFTDGSAIISGDFGSSGSSLVIDTNGPKGPNKGGRDIFRLNLDNNGKITGNDNCTENNRIDCFKHIMENGWKMDY